MKRVGIIGGGLGGLASACVLAARGYEVIVFERNDWLGGKAAVLEGHGFRFDMGPTILTLPSVLDRIFPEAGRDPASMLNLVRLDPQWRSFFDDGSTLDLVADTSAMAERLSAFSPKTKSAEGYRRFHCALREAPSHLRRLLFLEVDRRPSRHVRCARNVPVWNSRRRAGDAPGPFASREWCADIFPIRACPR